MLTVVTGAPCSGKSTYVRQHAVPGDVVIDFDLIAQALGSPVDHGHDSQYWKVAIEARDAAIKAAIGRHREGCRVWVIDSKPSPAKQEWYTKAGARFADLTASPAELHARAAAGRPASWHARIDTFIASDDLLPSGRTRW